MKDNYREEYENLFVYLRKCDLMGVRLNLEVGRTNEFITLEGTMLLNRFEIDINDDDISLSFDYGDIFMEKKMEILLSEYLKKDMDISYSIKDMNDPKREVKVYEWVKNKERISKIENSETVEYPLYITNINKRIKTTEEKTKKR